MWARIILTFLLFAKIRDGRAQRVEFTSPPATLSTTSYIQPSGQFVIPAVIKPLLSPAETALETVAPIVPSFPKINNFNGFDNNNDFNWFNGLNGFNGFNGMNNYNDFNGFNGFNGFSGFNGLNYPFIHHPFPVFCGNDDDNDWHHLLYFLIFAKQFGLGGFGGYGGYPAYSYGGYGPGYGGGYGGGCRCGGGCGCGGGHSCGCDSGCGGGYGGDGSCGSGFQDNCGCGCNDDFGNGITYVPYPIAVPFNFNNGIPSYSPVEAPPFGVIDDGQGTTFNLGGANGNEINLKITTETT